MNIIPADFAEHQDRYRLGRFLLRDVFTSPFLMPLAFKMTFTGLENIPQTGPTIAMINHIAASDPGFVMIAVKNRFVVPFSKIENFEIPVLNWFVRWWGMVPVKRGEVDRFALQVSIDLLQRGNFMVLAPEGTRNTALQEAKDGVVYLATKTNATVVPVGIDGTREFLSNVKRLRRTPVSINFGKPFRFKTEGKTRVGRDQMARMSQQAMYQLSALLPEYRRGFYADLSKMETDLLDFDTGV